MTPIEVGAGIERCSADEPQRFFTHGQSSTGDRHVYAARTGFIPNNLLKHFSRRAWPLAAPAGERSPSTGPKVDVRAKMQGMWR